VNKLVLVLFAVVLLAALGVGGFYLKETSFAFLFQTQNITADGAAQLASSDCKNTGFSTQAEAATYLESLFTKTGFTEEKGIKNNLMTSVIPISGNCWSVWIGDPNLAKTGILYWEDSKGSLKQKRATITIE
jgi:uncharacterized protein (UPF0333 family)